MLSWQCNVVFYKKKMPPALDVTVLIDVFKRPQDEKQTCMLAFIFLSCLVECFYFVYVEAIAAPPSQECLGKGAQMVPV